MTIFYINCRLSTKKGDSMTKIIVLIGLLIGNIFAKERETMKTIDLEKSALILIEYQNEWLGKNAKLANLMQDKKQFENSKLNSEKILEYARKIGINVIHVPLILSQDYKEFGKEKAKLGLRAVIQKVGTWQNDSKEFHKDFTPKEDEFVVSGRVGASGFAGSNLDAILRNNKIENLFLIGYATNVCVESTFREAHDKGYNTYIISDAVSAFTSEQKEFFEKHIVHHFGGLIDTEQFIKLENKKQAHDVALEFYKALGKGDMEKALSLVDEDIEYIAVKESSETYPELYGTYKGKEELQKFFIHLKEFYITKVFQVENFASNKTHAFIKGYLQYEIKKNHKEYDTYWMAFVEIKNDKIIKYQFFKDTASLEIQYSKK